MSFVIGRGRYAREAYPATGGVAAAAAAALTNRYLGSRTTVTAPSAFTVASPATHIVAAVNVTRRASGIFMLAVQMASSLAGADEQSWSAVALFGATCTGGVPYGDWLLDVASTITPSAPSGAFPLAADFIQSDAGNLNQNVTLVGANAAPMPPGKSTIIIAGTTTGGTQVTPGPIFATAYELP